MSPEVAPASTTESSAKRRRRTGWRRISLALVLGCLVTLGTAWGPGIRSFVNDLAGRLPPPGLPDSSDQLLLFNYDQQSIGYVDRAFWKELWNIGPTRSFRFPKNFPDAVRPHQIPGWAAHPPARFSDGFVPPRGIDATTEATGIPWRCAKSVILGGPQDGYFAYQRNGVLEWQGKGLYLGLPVFPIWPGLLGNIAVWSAAAFILLWSPSAIRRARRRRGGRCEACGYVLMGLREGRCPECGAEVALPPEPAAAASAERGAYADGHGAAGGGPGSIGS